MNVVLLNLIPVPFVPAMSPVEADHNPFEGEGLTKGIICCSKKDARSPSGAPTAASM